MNNIVIMGRLTASPEVKTSTSGKPVGTFCVAVDRKTKEKKTDFFNCVAFDKTADNIERFFNKGSKILLRGSMQSDQYESNGKKMTAWKLVVNEFDFVDGRDSDKPSVEPMKPEVTPEEDDDFPF